jgi:hypothetical protein
LYYLYFDGTVVVRPRELTLGRAAGAASSDSAWAATPPDRFWRLSLGENAREALRLPVWAAGSNFLVLLAAFLAAIWAAFSICSLFLTTLASSRATRFFFAMFLLYKVAAAFSFLVSAF